MFFFTKVFFWKRHREVTRSSVLSFHKRSHIIVINNIWLWTCPGYVQNLWAVKISSYERNIAWKHWISVNGFRSFQGLMCLGVAIDNYRHLKVGWTLEKIIMKNMLLTLLGAWTALYWPSFSSLAHFCAVFDVITLIKINIPEFSASNSSKTSVKQI